MNPDSQTGSSGTASSTADVQALLLRLWRATAPEEEREARRSETAAKHYLETRQPRSIPTKLFDPVHYAKQLPWFVREEVDPLVHYLGTGWAIGLSPHVAFDSAHLARQLGIRTWAEPPLLAFFEYASEVSAHPLFDVEIYGRYSKLSGREYARLFELFVDSWETARAPFSTLFSACFYGKFEPAALNGNTNPLLHYLMAEPVRRRDANPMFHNCWYDVNYPAGRGEPADPLLRFAATGLDEGHLPNPFAARELRLSNSGARVPRALLARYVDVSVLDADWFSAGAIQGTGHKPRAASAHTSNPFGIEMFPVQVTSDSRSQPAAACPN